MLFGRSLPVVLAQILLMISLTACSGGNFGGHNDPALQLTSDDGARLALLRNPTRIGTLTSGFGYRRHPLTGMSRPHRGIDLAAPLGTPVLAAEDGVVLDQGRRGSFGNLSTIKHGHHVVTAYAHLDRFEVGLLPGMRVAKGQVIGYVGTSGQSSGPHLHYEVVLNGRRIDPMGPPMSSIADRGLEGRPMAAGSLLASLSQAR